MLYTFIWVLAYGMLYTLSQTLSHITKRLWITPLAMLVFIGILLIWIFKTGRKSSSYLNTPKTDTPILYLFIFPLLLPGFFNLISAKGTKPSIATIILLSVAAVAEELLFRGFLLSFLLAKVRGRAILISAILFALTHIAGVAELGISHTLMQVLWAFAAGLFYAAVTLRLESILPCILAHIFTNATSLFNTGTLWIWPSIIIYLLCAVNLCFINKEKNK